MGVNIMDLDNVFFDLEKKLGLEFRDAKVSGPF